MGLGRMPGIGAKDGVGLEEEDLLPLDRIPEALFGQDCVAEHLLCLSSLPGQRLELTQVENYQPPAGNKLAQLRGLRPLDCHGGREQLHFPVGAQKAEEVDDERHKLVWKAGLNKNGRLLQMAWDMTVGM